MDQAKKGEIAFAILKGSLMAEGMRFDEETVQKLAKFADKAGIARGEVNEFFKELMSAVVDEAIGS